MGQNQVELYNEDCKSALERLISQGCQVDCILVDPPYNIGQASWDEGFDFPELIPLIQQILKPEGNLLVFAGWSHVCNLKLALDEQFLMRNWIIYDRIKGRGAKINLVSTREDLLWYTNNSPSLPKSKQATGYTFHRIASNIPKKTSGLGKKNGELNRILSNVWSDVSPIVPWSPERVAFPTQKPVALMERCLKVWTNEGDMVLDFTMGSGSTGVACQNLGRKFVGIEIDPDYFAIAMKRLDA